MAVERPGLILPHPPREGADITELRAYIIQLHKALEHLSFQTLSGDTYPEGAETVNVVSGSNNVVSGADNVVTSVY